jgi:hypothetical protein
MDKPSASGMPNSRAATACDKVLSCTGLHQPHDHIKYQQLNQQELVISINHCREIGAGSDLTVNVEGTTVYWLLMMNVFSIQAPMHLGNCQHSLNSCATFSHSSAH